MQPITEEANPLTSHIDTMTPLGMVRVLRQVDAQLFAGWQGEAGLMDEEVVAVIGQVASVAATVLAHPRGLVVLTGAGTSGRMAFLVARAFNLMLAPARSPFRYLTAGDDAALFMSREAPEDNWQTGRTRFLELLQESDFPCVLLVGITCGLSAPFVAAQLDHALHHLDHITPVILGFNPPRMARAAVVEGWDQTVASVVQRMLDTPGCFVLAPVVGPEAVTGSTRMKGGSATKIILETIFSLALATPGGAIGCGAVWTTLGEYERAVWAAYASAAPGMAQLVETTGRALSAGGRVAYLGQGPFGIVGLIDASECPPTFGAAPSDLRGYLDHGFATLGNQQGDLSAADPSLHLTWHHFATVVLPTFSVRDLVVFVPGDMPINNEAHAILRHCRVLRVPTALISVHLDNGLAIAPPLPADVCVVLRLSAVTPALLQRSVTCGTTASAVVATDAVTGPATHFFAELAVKLACNTATTGGHIRKGKILGNLMVDLQVSNNKLFHRAVGIVAHFGHTTRSAAEWALLRAIHGSDSQTSAPAVMELPVSAHVTQAAVVAQRGVRVVPTAIVLAAFPTLAVHTVCARLATTPLVHLVLAAEAAM